MKQTKRLKITEVRRRTLRVGFAPIPASPVCNLIVGTLSRAEAALALEITDAELARWIEQGRVHAIPMLGGGVRICQKSLFAAH